MDAMQRVEEKRSTWALPAWIPPAARCPRVPFTPEKDTDLLRGGHMDGLLKDVVGQVVVEVCGVRKPLDLLAELHARRL